MRLSLNLPNRAVTEHTGLSIASYARVGARVFAGGPDGLFEVTGTTDDGAAIESAFTLGLLDIDVDQQKRPKCAYVEASATAPIDLHVIHEGTDYSYPMDNDRTGLVVHKTPLGRGIRAKRLQIGVSSDGLVGLAAITIPVVDSSRRV